GAVALLRVDDDNVHLVLLVEGKRLEARVDREPVGVAVFPDAGVATARAPHSGSGDAIDERPRASGHGACLENHVCLLRRLSAWPGCPRGFWPRVTMRKPRHVAGAKGQG